MLTDRCYRLFFLPFLLCLGMLMLCAGTDAQIIAWDSTYGSPYTDYFADIVPSVLFSNYIMVGTSDWAGTGLTDMYVLKIDADGHEIWHNYFGTSGISETGNDVILLVDSIYVAIGDHQFVKFDWNGDVKWSQNFSGDAIAPGPGLGFFVIREELINPGNATYNFNLIFCDGTGDSVSTAFFSNPNECFPRQIHESYDKSRILMVGQQNFDASTYQAFLICVDSIGDSLWSSTYSIEGANTVATDLWPTYDGGFVVAGTLFQSPDSYRIYYFKVDSLGNEQWSDTLSSVEYQQATSIKMLPDSSFILTGYSTVDGIAPNDIIVAKISSSGALEWSSTYGDALDENIAYSIMPLPSEGWYALAGLKNSDAYVMKLLPAPLIVVAYSPVNIIVTDPNGDQFGKQSDGTPITEISPADYFETPHDSVVIYEPIPGEYTIEFVVEDGAEPGSTYSAIIRIDGTQAVVIVADEEVPESGIAGSYTYTVEESGNYTNGDANDDYGVNIGDAVFVINFVFKGGPSPDPYYAADANCDLGVNVGDAVYVINFVFKGGPPPCEFTP